MRTRSNSVSHSLLKAIQGATYQVRMRALKPTRLPAYPPELGSIIRAALHVGVTQLFCASRNSKPGHQCRKCRCLYNILLQPTMPKGHPMARKYSTPPPPYIIRPYPKRLDYETGDELEFDLLLFGKAVNGRLADLIMVLQHMAFNCLGTNPGSFQLTSVEFTPWNEEQAPKQVFPGSLPTQVDLCQLDAYPFTDETDRILLRFTNLSVLPYRGESMLLPTFKSFMDRLWDRASLMASIYGEIDYPENMISLTEAERVEVKPIKLLVESWDKKRSVRHGRIGGQGRESVVGLRGDILFKGPGIRPYLDLICLGELIQVGKYVPFGLGQYRLVHQKRSGHSPKSICEKVEELSSVDNQHHS
jgi:hypothetical protein